jgi:regulator of RNase E activity RraA
MNARVLAVYDRSILGDLAIETALQYSRTHDVAELHILAIAASPGDVTQWAVLNDDLRAFARLGQRQGVVVDGCVLDMPDVERMTTEIRQRKIDHLIIAEPADAENRRVMADLLDKAAKATGIATIVVREELP